jgi:hypothetical protein
MDFFFDKFIERIENLNSKYMKINLKILIIPSLLIIASTAFLIYPNYDSKEMIQNNEAKPNLEKKELKLEKKEIKPIRNKSKLALEIEKATDYIIEKIEAKDNKVTLLELANPQNTKLLKAKGNISITSASLLFTKDYELYNEKDEKLNLENVNEFHFINENTIVYSSLKLGVFENNSFKLDEILDNQGVYTYNLDNNTKNKIFSPQKGGDLFQLLLHKNVKNEIKYFVNTSKKIDMYNSQMQFEKTISLLNLKDSSIQAKLLLFDKSKQQIGKVIFSENYYKPTLSFEDKIVEF